MGGVNDIWSLYFKANLIDRLGIKNTNHSVCGWIRTYIRLIKSGQEENAHAVRILLEHLIDDLDTIERYSSRLYEQYKKVISKDYVGRRFEVNICARLIKKGIEFRCGVDHKGEADFYVNESGDSTIIECTSFNVKKASNLEELICRLSRKLKEKENKSYANKQTCLILDITSILHKTIKIPEASLKEDQEAAVFLNIKSFFEQQSSKFGCIIIFNQTYDRNKKASANHWKKFYKENCNSAVRNVVDGLFPTNKVTGTIILSDTLFPPHA